MNLSAKTLQVLKNFSVINPSILIQEGDILKTISPTKTVMAKAKLDEPFDKTFAIYDLGRFIGVLSLIDDAELKLTDRIITIKGKDGDSISYTCADPSNIVTPPEKDIKLPTVDVTFTLKEAAFAKTMKALSVLSLPEIALVGDGKMVYFQAVDSKNPTGDVYRTPVGETDKNFKAIFKSENMKMLPGDYEVSVSSKGLSYFKGAALEYWVAVEGNSKFD